MKSAGESIKKIELNITGRLRIRRVLVVFNKFDIGRGLVLSGFREEIYGRRAKSYSIG